MKTKYKIFFAKILSFIITLFISKKQNVRRSMINWNLNLREGIDLSIFVFGLSERKILNLKKLLNTNSKLFFLDIGANIGSVSLPLAKLFHKSKIYSLEPTNYAFKKLKKNLSLNKDLKQRIFLNQFFISNTKKPKKVWSSWSLEDRSSHHKLHRGYLKSIKSNTYITLDSFIKKNRIKKIDFIKLDVDGYELDVLKSGSIFFKKNKPILFIEIAPYLYTEFGYDCLDLIKYIKKYKYNFYDENLNKIEDIYKLVKKIKFGSSKNFFLY
tara:strand:+ start:334 stop:1140 length:807 start_codon:yes stop_codon:yes gene_type:complete